MRIDFAAIRADKAEVSTYETDAQTRLAQCGGTIKIKLSDTKVAPWEDKASGYRPHYRITLSGPGGSYALNFWGSLNDGESGARAGAYDVLSCLEWSDPGSFEDFCGEFGYEPDSIKANKTWRAVKAQAAALARIFPSESARETLGQIR